MLAPAPRGYFVPVPDSYHSVVLPSVSFGNTNQHDSLGAGAGGSLTDRLTSNDAVRQDNSIDDIPSYRDATNKTANNPHDANTYACPVGKDHETKIADYAGLQQKGQ